MKKDDRKRQLEQEVARLREVAFKSTDNLVVSKAVAASDPNVQSIILKRLDSGELLVEVLAWGGMSRTEIKVFFRFAPPDQAVRLVDSGFLVFVDSIRGEVIGTVDPYVRQPEDQIARPFVMINPPPAGEADQDSEGDARRAAFFSRVGYTWAGGIYTVDPTIFGTETYSGGRRDDTRSDRTCDYNDCAPGPILT